MPQLRRRWTRENQEMKAEELNLSVTDLSLLIDQWIFNERDRAILKRRYCDGITYARIAEEFDMSDRQIVRICYKQFERVIRHAEK